MLLLLYFELIEMELKLNIGYQELLALIRQLPLRQLNRLKTDLRDIDPTPKSGGDWKSFLLSGPVMTEQQYVAYTAQREHFERWRSE